MKLFGKLVCAGPFLFLLYAAPAFAQFEINPDHFGSVINQAPPKTSVASKRKTAWRHVGPQVSALRRSQTPNSEAQPARTRSFEKAQATSVQRHGHARKAHLSAKVSAKFQRQQQTAQVALVPE